MGAVDLNLISMSMLFRRRKLGSMCPLDCLASHFANKEDAKIRTVAAAFAVCIKVFSLPFNLSAGGSKRAGSWQRR